MFGQIEALEELPRRHHLTLLFDELKHLQRTLTRVPWSGHDLQLSRQQRIEDIERGAILTGDGTFVAKPEFWRCR